MEIFIICGTIIIIVAIICLTQYLMKRDENNSRFDLTLKDLKNELLMNDITLNNIIKYLDDISKFIGNKTDNIKDNE